jgi:hypothetical protein
LRRRLIVPAALVAASALVVVRRAARHAESPGRPRTRVRRAGEEALATSWAWPEAPAAEPAPAEEPMFQAPAWHGDVRDPSWAVAAPEVVTAPPAEPAASPAEEPEALLGTPEERLGPEAPPATAAVPLEESPAVAEAPWDAAPPDADEPSHEAVAEAEAWWDEDDAVAASSHETVVDSGPFAFGGWAPQPGATAVMGVTFSRRVAEAPGADRVRLTLRSATNVPDGGLVVLSDAGFAPDREGFALMLASAQAGSFLASGRWELLATA